MANETIIEVVENILRLSNTVVGSIVLEDAKRHFRSACKEALLGMIVILEHTGEKQKNQTTEGVHQEKHSIRNIDITD